VVGEGVGSLVAVIWLVGKVVGSFVVVIWLVGEGVGLSVVGAFAGEGVG